MFSLHLFPHRINSGNQKSTKNNRERASNLQALISNEFHFEETHVEKDKWKRVNERKYTEKKAERFFENNQILKFRRKNALKLIELQEQFMIVLFW